MLTFKDKLAAVEAHLDEQVPLRELAKKYGVHHSSIEKWIHNYQIFGDDGLKRAVYSKRYTEEEKLRAVKSYQSDQHTLYSVCRLYKIRSISTLQSWILKYQKSGSDLEEKGNEETEKSSAAGRYDSAGI